MFFFVFVFFCRELKSRPSHTQTCKCLTLTVFMNFTLLLIYKIPFIFYNGIAMPIFVHLKRKLFFFLNLMIIELVIFVGVGVCV